ncbi:MAG TPA: glycoside hydrolase family 2 TIM barrel-domain containing protein [Caproicibacter sp.]|nr:glycoside hydrolase family 2 TIM barrel-domain containing protein [Caproicibacter sp.]
MQKLIRDNFRISIAGKNQWYPFSIPGSAMTTYVKQGIIPDPFEGMNEYAVKEFLRNDFEIEGTFEITAKEYRRPHLELVFHSVDTIADIYLNNRKLGHAENMHRTYVFPCRDLAKEGENTLSIKIYSALEYIENRKPAKDREITMANTGTLVGEQYLRKAHSMFGWDWGPQLPDCGIYGDIKLFMYEKVKLEETLIRQIWNKDQVTLHLSTEISGETDSQAKIRYQVTNPDGVCIYDGFETEISIAKPELWWPNGYGKQPLYFITVILDLEGEETQKKEYTIGLRRLTVSQEEDQWGREFSFMVNGVKIFLRGANYIPDDCFYPRITHEILKRDVEAAVYANFNSLRVWGGGYYPSDDFYELCDKYGIIVWQDFMFACNVYDLDDTFIDNILQEAKDNLARFRNHPCLGLICGNNEMEVAWLEWADMKHHAPSLRKDYLLQFEYYLANAVKKYAPDTFYWPSSPSSGGSFDNPGDENRGDSHYWDVWHGQKPYTDYQKHFFRFCSEFGFQSLPSIKTIKTFTKEEDRNLFSRVMESHQKNPEANGKILYYLSETFQYPKNLESLVFLSQVMQGFAIKSGVDHWRRNRGRCMGSIYWQFNDNWPVLSWSSIDYYGRYKALHYMAREFYAPVAGSIEQNGADCRFWISNETMKPCRIEGIITLKTLGFEVLDEIHTSETIDPLCAKCIFTKDYESLIRNRDDSVFVVMEYHYSEDGEQKSRQEWSSFVPVKYLRLQNPHIEIRTNGQQLELTAKSFVPYCMLENDKEDCILNKNVFAVTDTKPVELEACANGNVLTPDVLDTHHWKIYDVYHTYNCEG